MSVKPLTNGKHVPDFQLWKRKASVSDFATDVKMTESLHRIHCLIFQLLIVYELSIKTMSDTYGPTGFDLFFLSQNVQFLAYILKVQVRLNTSAYTSKKG